MLEVTEQLKQIYSENKTLKSLETWPSKYKRLDIYVFYHDSRKTVLSTIELLLQNYGEKSCKLIQAKPKGKTTEELK